jgi:putative intracellular protease/amidase
VNDKAVAFVLYPGLTPLDLIGPLQVMTGLETAEAMFDVQPRHNVMVVAESLDAVPTDTPVRIAATSTLDEVSAPDVIVVPGGGAPTLRQLANPVLLDYLRKADRSAEVVASVCTGSLLLAGAGLLEGRRATTHWKYHRFLDRLGATYHASQRLLIEAADELPPAHQRPPAAALNTTVGSATLLNDALAFGDPKAARLLRQPGHAEREEPEPEP